MTTSSDEDEPEEKKSKQTPQRDWDQQSDPDFDIMDDELIGSSQAITIKAITTNTGVYFRTRSFKGHSDNYGQ